jgi:hypothetical protein
LRELSLHLLDIAENSIAAEASCIRIEVAEDTRTDLLQMSVEDNGRGMNPEMVAIVTDPFTTSRTTRKVGLGIPLLKAAAEACNGFLKIESEPGKGTRLVVQFQRSHIDRMPLGDLVTTMLNLITTNPQVHWIFLYIYNGKEFMFDDAPIKNELVDVPLTEPEVLKVLNEMINSGIREINPEYSMDHVSTS